MEMFEGVGRRSDQSTGSFLDIGQHSLNGRERNCLFRNDGDGGFTDVGFVNGADRIEDGRGLSVLDYDRDGRLDLLIRNYRQPAQLLRNVGPARHWLALRLVGTRSNRDAVGATLRVETADGSHDAHRHGRLGLPVGLQPGATLRARRRRARHRRGRMAVRRPHHAQGRAR